MAMLGKKVIPITKANSIVLKCGDCLHYKRNAKFEKPCSQLGIKHFKDAPACFSPDVYLLNNKNPDRVLQLGLLLNDFTASETRILMSLLKSSVKYHKYYGLVFGQPVYFFMARDYLSNYFRGYFLGAAQSGESQVYITSDMSNAQRRNPLIASMYRESVFTVSEFKKHRQKLIKTGKVNDPVSLSEHYKPKTIVNDGYEPPTMEKAPPELLGKYDHRLDAKKLKRNVKDGSLEYTI